MKSIRALPLITLLLAISCGLAQAVHVQSVPAGEWNQSTTPSRFLKLKLDRSPTADEVRVLEDPNLYFVAEEPSTSGTSTTTSTGLTPLSVTVATVSVIGSLPVNEVRVVISGGGFGKGILKIALDPEVTKGLVLADQPSFNWVIESQNSATKLNTNIATTFDAENLTARFSIAASTALFTATKRSLLYRANDVVRKTFSFSGNVPLRKPSDASNAGTSTDASGQTANYLDLAYEERSYNGSRINSIGVIARVTSTGRGFEGVLNYTPLAMIDLNKGYFVAAEFEGGYRSGDAEWTSLTHTAPNSGNIVARLGGVIEFMPRFKSLVNTDRSTGLRFFVRARGWLDGYRSASDEFTGRFRHFLDAELFYDFSAKFRVFIRGEQGYFPPDLSRRVGRIFVGVGSAF